MKNIYLFNAIASTRHGTKGIELEVKKVSGSEIRGKSVFFGRIDLGMLVSRSSNGRPNPSLSAYPLAYKSMF